MNPEVELIARDQKNNKTVFADTPYMYRRDSKEQKHSFWISSKLQDWIEAQGYCIIQESQLWPTILNISYSLLQTKSYDQIEFELKI